MIGLVSALALTLISATLIWFHKPEEEWSGSGAAYFMAGLAGACFGFMSLIAPEQKSTLSLMLEQLCLYAVLPLLVSVEIANFFKKNWSRQIWGRVLLAIAATFELCRRNDVLNEMLLVTLALGAIALLATAKDKPKGLGWAQAGDWMLISALFYSQFIALPSTAYCALLIIAIFPITNILQQKQ